MERSKLRALAEKATPGPWSWFGNTKMHSIYLATVNRGRRYVLDFARWGMRGAQPRFQDYSRGTYGIMRDAKELVIYEVEYRKDFHEIDNPDARWIAAADPTTVLALLDALETAERERDEARRVATMYQAAADEWRATAEARPDIAIEDVVEAMTHLEAALRAHASKAVR